MSKIPRAFNARGPRCGEGRPGFKAWPPRLIKGHGVARWENTGATSIIEIPAFRNVTIEGGGICGIYGQTIDAIERHAGNGRFNKVVSVSLGSDDYSPSAIQRFSERGWLKLDCGYYARWRMIQSREVPGIPSDATGEDTVIFARWGWRPDHVDQYYNWGPFAGLHWE